MSMRPVSFDAFEIFCRTIYGETRGEGFDVKLLVGWTIRNRAEIEHKFPTRGIDKVCKHKYQYKCWIGSSKEKQELVHVKLPDEEFSDSIRAASQVLRFKYDHVKYLGSDHPAVLRITHYRLSGLRGPAPKWTHRKEPVIVLGRYMFYNNVI